MKIMEKIKQCLLKSLGPLRKLVISLSSIIISIKGYLRFLEKIE